MYLQSLGTAGIANHIVSNNYTPANAALANGIAYMLGMFVAMAITGTLLLS